ncbi:MAG: NADPH-dependent F420 reductase [Trueperaceae bacterium]|nr:MAG: NADPH-dependent F420 reductase [Trueperaceae bacterium]
MNIAIIGTGNVGRALGTGWAAAGHTIIFGSRSPDDPAVKELVATTGATSRATTPPNAAREAEVVLIATPWRVTEQVLKTLGSLHGKILIDATNPVGTTVTTADSAAELVNRWAEGARVVKAFNTTGSKNMLEPNYRERALDMFICGDDEAAKQVVDGLAKDLGFSTVDCGPLSNASLLENLAMLWIQLAYSLGNGPDIGFALLRR